MLPSAPDARALRRAFSRAAPGFAAADFFHAEIRSRLLDRLDFVRLAPRVVADLGSGPGDGAAALASRYPEARILAVDSSAAMCGEARRRHPADGPHSLCADAGALPLAADSVDLVFSNLMLHCCPEIGAVLQEVRRVLRHPGLFTFTTLGPDSLIELRSAWAEADPLPHLTAFPEMHLLGDALVRAGFAEPVMATERLTVTYPDISRLAADARAVGAVNVAAGRRRSLTAPGRWRALQAAYDRHRDAGGRLPVTMEIIFGQAWAGIPRQRGDDGEVHVPLAGLQRRRPAP